MLNVLSSDPKTNSERPSPSRSIRTPLPCACALPPVGAGRAYVPSMVGAPAPVHELTRTMPDWSSEGWSPHWDHGTSTACSLPLPRTLPTAPVFHRKPSEGEVPVRIDAVMVVAF